MRIGKIFTLFAILIFAGIQNGFSQEESTDFDADAYVKSTKFKEQIGKTQMIAGAMLLPMSAGLIAGGIYKFTQAGKPTVGPEDTYISTNNNKGAAAGIVSAGGLAGITGAILMWKGMSTLKKIRNKNEEVVGEINLPSNGELGISVKF